MRLEYNDGRGDGLVGSPLAGEIAWATWPLVVVITLGAGEQVLPPHDGNSPRRGVNVMAIILPLHRCLQCLGLRWPRLHVMTGVFDWPVIPAEPGDDVNNIIVPRRHSGHFFVGIGCNREVDLREVGQLRMDIFCVHRVHRHVLVIGRHEVEVHPYSGQQEFNVADDRQ